MLTYQLVLLVIHMKKISKENAQDISLYSEFESDGFKITRTSSRAQGINTATMICLSVKCLVDFFFRCR